MKKLISLCFIFIISVSFIACRQRPDADSASGEGDVVADTKTETRDPGPAFPDPETVRAILAGRAASERAATQETASRQPERRQRLPMLQNGEQARSFEATTLDGNTIKLNEYRGKTVLLNFWASWCGPCRQEIPHIKRIADSYKDNNDFAVIGISLDRSERAMTDFVNRQKMDWPNVFDGPSAQIASLYGVKGIPYNLLIGPDGSVIATGLRGQAIARELSVHL